jgi:hypothetical protein
LRQNFAWASSCIPIPIKIHRDLASTAETQDTLEGSLLTTQRLDFSLQTVNLLPEFTQLGPHMISQSSIAVQHGNWGRGIQGQQRLLLFILTARTKNSRRPRPARLKAV